MSENRILKIRINIYILYSYN